MLPNHCTAEDVLLGTGTPYMMGETLSYVDCHFPVKGIGRIWLGYLLDTFRKDTVIYSCHALSRKQVRDSCLEFAHHFNNAPYDVFAQLIIDSQGNHE